MRTPTYVGGIEVTRPGCATGNTTLLQATDSAILAGFITCFDRPSKPSRWNAVVIRNVSYGSEP